MPCLLWLICTFCCTRISSQSKHRNRVTKSSVPHLSCYAASRAMASCYCTRKGSTSPGPAPRWPCCGRTQCAANTSLILMQQVRNAALLYFLHVLCIRRAANTSLTQMQQVGCKGCAIASESGTLP